MIYLRLFFEFFKIGLFAIGGGLATFPFLESLSEKTGWFSISQLIDMINQMADKIIESEMDSESDEVKQEWKRLYLRDNLSTYIDFDRVERLRELEKYNNK